MRISDWSSDVCSSDLIRKTGKAPFQIVIPRLAFSEPQPPAVVVDHDANMIRIVERCRTASEGGIVEVPFRRSQLPDKLRKLLPVPCVAGLAPFGGEIVLVPPFEFGLRRQRHPARLQAADHDRKSTRLNSRHSC